MTLGTTIGYIWELYRVYLQPPFSIKEQAGASSSLPQGVGRQGLISVQGSRIMLGIGLKAQELKMLSPNSNPHQDPTVDGGKKILHHLEPLTVIPRTLGPKPKP